MAGNEAGWDRSAFVVRCLACVADAESAALEMLFNDVDVTQPGMHKWVTHHELRLSGRLTAHRNTLNFLEDRRILRSRSTIDHIVVGPSGVFVIITKSYANAKVDTLRTGGIFTPTKTRLLVGDRDKSSLVSAMNRQVEAVLTALEQNIEFIDVEVSAILCIVDGVFPWVGTIDVDGVRVRNLNATVRAVAADGIYDAQARAHIIRQLSKHLPPVLRR